MKSVYIFNHEHYHNALKSQIQSQYVPHFGRQRGGGLGGIINGVTQYLIPVTKKYVVPELKNAAARTFNDVIQGTPSTNALIANTKSLIENVGRDIAQSNFKQEGGYINRKRKTSGYQPISNKKTSKNQSRKTKKITKNTCIKKCKSKRDIFA